MLDQALAWLKKNGHEKIMVNAHHLWEQVAEWAEINDVELQVELPEILGTGGGLAAERGGCAARCGRGALWGGAVLKLALFSTAIAQLRTCRQESKLGVLSAGPVD